MRAALALAVLGSLVALASGCVQDSDQVYGHTGANFIPEQTDLPGGLWDGYVVKDLQRVRGGYVVCRELASEPVAPRVGSSCRQRAPGGFAAKTGHAEAMSLRDALGHWLKLDDAGKAGLTFGVLPVFNRHGQVIEGRHVISFKVHRAPLQ